MTGSTRREFLKVTAGATVLGGIVGARLPRWSPKSGDYGLPATLFGLPVVISENVPAIRCEFVCAGNRYPLRVRVRNRSRLTVAMSKETARSLAMEGDDRW